MTKIKICGLTREKDILVVNEVLPDYIGFVFAKSKRQVSKELAYKLKKQLSPSIEAVGVFVNEEMESIIDLCQRKIIDLVQLHGEETTDYIKKLRQEIPNQIIKVIRVRNQDDIKRSMVYIADFILFDSYHGSMVGGSGMTFDWSLIKNIPIPYFLAGGIRIDNIELVLKQEKLYGIDVSSGVEIDGFKDAMKIKELVTMVRSVR
ncbi:MAG: hypothetical protein K0S47_2883 [Herbinix sp.]|jgi:phosphoribosylanthranilate isomerase|nr:hypothetical protein [Herbinix sp.]